ncbi:MAG: hypothetical protein HeimC2_23280 [Candidatus Heimdallarchaeota archaeon LC_2]|nr:MAG: hypothetical protein HeimC2_23280 [Candidatus Heimdallarchaeota archaeon LC_2]
MSKENKLEFFVYNHSNREFKEASKDAKKLTGLIGGTPEEVGQQLSLEEIDALLVLDNEGERWFLSYSDTLGIIGQRTSRRQADTIARSGYRMPAGYTIKGNYPMVETNDVDIGDLWKTVQQKYVISDLSGMSLDEETGIPSQLADRAELMKAEGHEDALTEAKLEKEEAEVRKRAMQRSGSPALKKMVKKEATPKYTPKPTPEPTPEPIPKTTSKPAPKASAKNTAKTIPSPAPEPKAVEEKSEAKEITTKKSKKSTKKSTIKSSKKAQKKTKKVTKKKSASGSGGFFEVISVKQNVTDGNTQTVAKGKLTYDSDTPTSETIVFDQEHLTQKEWTQIGLFIQKGDILQVDISTEKGLEYATSLKI